MEAAVGLPSGLAGHLPRLGMNIFSQMSALAAKYRICISMFMLKYYMLLLKFFKKNLPLY